MWQACPVCNGQGNNMLGRPCHVCNGHGIISTISGLPPVHRKYNATTSSTTMTYSDRDEKRSWICLEMSNK